MEAVWKWFLRFLLTVILILVIGLLSLGVVSVPRVWNTMDKFGDAAEVAERAARSIYDTSERAFQEIEEWDER